MSGQSPDLRDVPEPAWVIDLDSAEIVAASPSGRLLWEGAWREGASLDAAMPALVELNRFVRTAKPAEVVERSLVIWTSEGTAHLRCRCQLLAAPGHKVLVTSIEELDPRSASHANGDKGRAVLAHELRTPLSAIAALAEVMKEEQLGAMENARYLVYASDIYDSARHALSVIESMLEDDSGRPNPKDLANTDINETVSKCVSALGALAEKAGVRLEVRLAKGSLRLPIERHSLMQILLNLLSNALKFTPRGGGVTVETRREADGGLVLSVTDTGPGVSREQLQRLKEGKPLDADVGGRQGLGIGLPLVRALARSAGAELEIDSDPGRGTRASLLFPPAPLADRTPA